MPTITAFIAAFILLTATALFAAPPERKPIDQLPVIADLPDPFLLPDGSRVKSASEWSAHRKDLAGLVLAYEYGAMPPDVTNLKSEIISSAPTTRPAEMPGATETQVLLTTGPESKIKLHLHLYIPAQPNQADATARFPLIACGDAGRAPWGIKPEIVAAIVTRGYILAAFDRTELFADSKVRSGGVLDAWPDYNGSAMCAWAWGYHRVVDYALTRADVDPKHIAISGHSRGGKCVLLAGALDERIALTNPNGSGCGGGGCYRDQAPKSEAIENILKNFPFWFEPHFGDFIGHVDQLPIDQHTIKALVAPRALLETNGLGDLWANPEGAQQTYLAAREVFDFLDARDQIAVAWREGKHEHNLQDWTALLDFADWRFFGKRAGRAFDTLAFPESPKKFTWGKP